MANNSRRGRRAAPLNEVIGERDEIPLVVGNSPPVPVPPPFAPGANIARSPLDQLIFHPHAMMK
jgi:hypothetical protein